MGRTTGVEVGIGLASPTGDVGVMVWADGSVETAAVIAGEAELLSLPVPQAANTTVATTTIEAVISNDVGSPALILITFPNLQGQVWHKSSEQLDAGNARVGSGCRTGFIRSVFKFELMSLV